jgi:hypothetical protein
MSADWPTEIPTSIPIVHARDKPVIYTADGVEIVIKKPVGFAGHPDVPTQKIKKGR